MPRAIRIVVAGIAGAGKSTVGRLLAEQFGAAYVDGDDCHPPENVARMAAGTPLTDADRAPWLVEIGERLRDAPGGVVVSCSALKRSYRDGLRGIGDVRFVFLDVTRATAIERTTDRTGHYMGPGMIDSQLASLERPGADEPDVLVVPGGDDPAETVLRVVSALR